MDWPSFGGCRTTGNWGRVVTLTVEELRRLRETIPGDAAPMTFGELRHFVQVSQRDSAQPRGWMRESVPRALAAIIDGVLAAARPTVYLASRYSRREELCGYREELRSAGFEVTSRWLNGEHQAADENPGPLARLFAEEDYEDLMRAGVVIAFTEKPRTGASRGGRHVEWGIALAMGKRTLCVGPRENVFHWLPAVEQFDRWPSALAALTGDAS